MIVLRTLFGVFGVPESRRERRLGRAPWSLGAQTDQGGVSRRQERNPALAGIRLGGRPGDEQPPAGQVKMLTAQLAELVDARAGEQQRLDRREPRNVVTTTRFRLAAPQLVAPDLPDEHVGDAELLG
jgi:hypothetical protein